MIKKSRIWLCNKYTLTLNMISINANVATKNLVHAIKYLSFINLSLLYVLIDPNYYLLKIKSVLKIFYDSGFDNTLHWRFLVNPRQTYILIY